MKILSILSSKITQKFNVSYSAAKFCKNSKTIQVANFAHFLSDSKIAALSLNCRKTHSKVKLFHPTFFKQQFQEIWEEEIFQFESPTKLPIGKINWTNGFSPNHKFIKKLVKKIQNNILKWHFWPKRRSKANFVFSIRKSTEDEILTCQIKNRNCKTVHFIL